LGRERVVEFVRDLANDLRDEILNGEKPDQPFITAVG